MYLKRLGVVALAGVIVATAAPSVRADEGMWTFNNVPKAEIKKLYGVDVSDVWLRKVQLGCVRFNSGGSGSFVSADGLVMTNHHVASDTLAKINTPERDYFKTGFLARSRDEEVQAPDLELNVLISIEDVTARVNAAAKSGTSPAEANAARRAVMVEIENESLAATGLRSDVVTLYQGGLYNLYRYKKYTDVRLVFAPEFDVAFFGGDPDNFTFPRYDLDLALFRVYEDGKPIRTENYFKWSKTGSKAGDVAFVAGHPGGTQRLNTVAHLEYLRDEELPFSVEYIGRTVDVLKRYTALGDEQERQAHDALFGYQNSFKVYKGRLAGLKSEKLLGPKRAKEATLRKKVAADKKMRGAYGNAWSEIAASRASLRSYDVRRRMLEGKGGFNSELFYYARLLVRLPTESAKPNTERLKEFTDAARPALERALFAQVPLYPALEEATLADSLAFLQEKLGASDPTVRKVLDGKTPDARAKELVDGSRLASAEVRKRLAEGGPKAIEASDDPMILLARAVDAESRELRRRYDDEVLSVERVAYAKIAQALFAVEGTRVAPDANFTLRLSYGAVKGYEENGKTIPAYTTTAGMFERSDRAGNKAPYHLPDRWLKAKERLDLKTPFNLVSTNDIIGGSSGSPVLDEKAEVIGLVFDGNIQSLVGNFGYDDTQNRTVSVDSRVILEALVKVYEAKELVEEMTR